VTLATAVLCGGIRDRPHNTAMNLPGPPRKYLELNRLTLPQMARRFVGIEPESLIWRGKCGAAHAG
jgi:hypothetical protein